MPLQFIPSSAHDSQHWTTNQGAPVWNNNASLTAGPRGPILLEDFHLVEKLANFDRERIPERVVHARGAAAKGFFEVCPNFPRPSHSGLEQQKETQQVARRAMCGYRAKGHCRGMVSAVEHAAIAT